MIPICQKAAPDTTETSSFQRLARFNVPVEYRNKSDVETPRLMATSGNGADIASAPIRNVVALVAVPKSQAFFGVAIKRPIFGNAGDHWGPRPLWSRTAVQGLGHATRATGER